MPKLKYKGRIIKLPYTKAGYRRAKALRRKGARSVKTRSYKKKY